MSYYYLMKDFAGPAATVFAAVVAAGITIRFSRMQYRLNARIAELSAHQALVAHEKLRFDLFDKRYAIYIAARDALVLCRNHAGQKNFDTNRLNSYLVTIDEAPLFFGEDVVAFLKKVRRSADKIQSLNFDPREFAVEQSILQRLLDDVFTVFSPELEHRQLTKPGAKAFD